MQVHHVHVPWNNTGVEVHGNNDEAVHDLMTQHVLLTEQISQKSGGCHTAGSTQHRACQRNQRSLHDARNFEHLHIVFKMDPPGIQQNQSTGGEIVVADRIDEQIVKREHANQHDQREKNDIHNIHNAFGR